MPNMEVQWSSCPLLACGAFWAQREDWTWESLADEGARPRGSPRADTNMDATQRRTWGSLHDSRAGRPRGPLSGMVDSATVRLRSEVAWAPGGNTSRLSSLQRHGRYFWLGCYVNPELHLHVWHQDWRRLIHETPLCPWMWMEAWLWALGTHMESFSLPGCVNSVPRCPLVGSRPKLGCGPL